MLEFSEESLLAKKSSQKNHNDETNKEVGLGKPIHDPCRPVPLFVLDNDDVMLVMWRIV